MCPCSSELPLGSRVSRALAGTAIPARTKSASNVPKIVFIASPFSRWIGATPRRPFSSLTSTLKRSPLLPTSQGHFALRLLEELPSIFVHHLPSLALGLYPA